MSAQRGSRDYEAIYGFALTEEERAIADLFHARVEAGTGIFVHPDIPSDKLQNARNKYASIAEDEAILGLVDNTVMGSAKEGLLLTVRGICWRNMWESGHSREYSTLGSVSWKTGFTSSGLHVKGGHHIQLMNDRDLASLGGFLNAARTVEVSPWHIGQDSQQWGPLSIEAISGMIEQEELDTSCCLAWKQGMGSWLPMHQVPELRHLASTPPPLTAVAPPPLSSSATPPMPSNTTGAGTAAPTDGDAEGIPPPLSAKSPLEGQPPPSAEGPSESELVRVKLRHRMQAQRGRFEAARAKAVETENAEANDLIREALRERLLEEAESALQESSGRPGSLIDCSGYLDALDAKIKAAEAALDAPDNDAFLAGLQNLYGGSGGDESDVTGEGTEPLTDEGREDQRS